MKHALILIVLISAIALAIYKFTAPSSSDAKIPMPWQITVIDADHLQVFDLVLNQTRLEQAVERFGVLDDIAIYRDQQGRFSLEAYLGKVSLGPLSARLILNLDASQEQLSQISAETKKRTITKKGSEKWSLSDYQKQQQLQRTIRGLTYIPDYSGMDAQFLIKQFGQPQSREPVDENSELLFYPQLGVRILVDEKGKEVFEYMPPARFAATMGEPS